jgi:hypothetical protein
MMPEMNRLDTVAVVVVGIADLYRAYHERLRQGYSG